MKKIGISILLLLASSCTKKVTEVNNPDSEFIFYNASDYLQASFLSVNSMAYVMIDTADSAGYRIPIQNSLTAGAQTWGRYLRIEPGVHHVTLTDTGAHLALITDTVQTMTGVPVSQYFADSLGTFRAITLRDTVTENPGGVQLRVLDLSPDAGPVFFTIAQLAATGFPDTLRYGTATPFTPWTSLGTTGALLITFFNVGDSIDVIASGSLNVIPAHAYTIVLAGYENEQYYVDPLTKQFLDFFPDLRLQLYQTN